MTMLDKLDRELINRYQGGFPICQRPFDQLADEFNLTGKALLKRIDQLLASGWLTRFGPLYNAERFGGSLTLAALEVPEDSYTSVTNLINSMPSVAHNYRREHRLNMWFVIATESPEALTQSITEIEHKSGLRVYNFPKLQEFYLGLWFKIGEEGSLQTISIPNPNHTHSSHQLDDIDRRIILESQEGLPLEERPYAHIARRAELDEADVMHRMQQMLDAGAIRRIGLVPNHYKLGFRGNGMSVWDIPDEKLAILGPKVAALDFVSHCYQRPRYPEIWPYNLFAMVHGGDRATVCDKTRQIVDLLGDDCHAHEVLFSTEVLKKTGLRLTA